MLKTLHFILIVFSFIGMSFESSAQVLKDYNDISIFFGDKIKSGTSVVSLENTKSNELLSIQNKLSIFHIFSRNNSKYTFNLINDYSLPNTKPVKFYGEGKKTSLIEFTHIGNQVLGLSYRSTFLNKTPKLFYHFIDPRSGGNVNHGFPIISFNSMYKTIDLSRLSMVSSNDTDFAAVLYIPTTKSEEYTTIKYAVIRDNHSIVKENEFIYPYPSLAYEPLDYLIIDGENQLFITGHYSQNKAENNWNNGASYFKKISVTKVTGDTLSFEEIEPPGKYFTDVEAYNHQDEIILSGLYSSYLDGQIEGTFISVIGKDGKLRNSHFTKFPTELLGSLKVFKTDYFTNQVRTHSDYRKFNILDFHAMEDGYILSAEYNAIEYRYGGTDVPGATNVIDTYYWSSDIIICKIDKKGQLMWSKIVPKIQRSLNDGGYYLSTASYFGEERIHLFFNDNLSNYNGAGSYNKIGDTPLPAQFNASQNTIAHVSINIKNGQTKRSSTVGRQETNIIFVPKLSVPFPNNKNLMIYGRSGNKHRIGSVSFSK